MEIVFVLLVAQSLLGAFDTWVIHEWRERLPRRPVARREVGLHALREVLYAVIFIGLAGWQWGGLWAWVLATVLLVEVVITALDFVEEDRIRVLSPLERVTHLLLAILYGALLARLAEVLWTWQALPTELVASDMGLLSGIIALFGLGVLLQSLRSAHAWWRLASSAPALTRPQSMHRL